MSTVDYNRLRKDQFWKSGIEQFIRPALEYIFGDEAHLFDLNQVEFLDKEMAAIRPASQSSQRITDKLVRLRHKDGQELWVLLYIEV